MVLSTFKSPEPNRYTKQEQDNISIKTQKRKTLVKQYTTRILRNRKPIEAQNYQGSDSSGQGQQSADVSIQDNEQEREKKQKGKEEQTDSINEEPISLDGDYVQIDDQLISRIPEKKIRTQDYVHQKQWLYEPLYGMPMVKEMIGYGELIRDIRLNKVEAVHWFSSAGIQTPNPHCLIEYTNNRVKKARIPHNDWRLQFAMENHNVQQVRINPTPPILQSNPLQQIQQQIYRGAEKALPFVFLLMIWYFSQLAAKLKGDMDDREKIRRRDIEDKKKLREQAKADRSFLEITDMVKKGQSDDSIISSLKSTSVNFDEQFLRDIIRQERIDQGFISQEDMTEDEKKMMAQRAANSMQQDSEQQREERQDYLRQQQDDQSGQDFIQLKSMKVRKRRDPKTERMKAAVRQAQRRMKGIKLQYTGEDTVFFEDVAGIGEAKVELAEVVDFFLKPERFIRSGARIPRGILLHGPPGNGKTLLARAVAGESGVAFMSVNASEFVEMFVGVGAARVRDLFKQARDMAPAVIFVDEIDAIGRKRQPESGNTEREQTLNQMLTELDGFKTDNRVIVMAATNRIDVLDAALIRPGRFDRIIEVQLPDIYGRLEILQVHINKVAHEDDINLREIANQTDGKSGADLAQVVNTAALLAARDNRERLTQNDLTKALVLDTVGTLRQPFSAEKMRRVAIIQAAAALIISLSPSQEELVYVSIESRELYPLGQTLQKLNEVKIQTNMYTKRYLEERIEVMLSGRAAEELVYGSDGMSTLNQKKLQIARQLAQKLCVSGGMSQLEEVGQRVLTESKGGSLQRPTRVLSNNIPTTVRYKIEDFLVTTLNHKYSQVMDTIQRNRQCFDKLVESLIEKQILFGDDVLKIVREYANSEDLQKCEQDRELTI